MPIQKNGAAAGGGCPVLVVASCLPERRRRSRRYFRKMNLPLSAPCWLCKRWLPNNKQSLTLLLQSAQKKECRSRRMGWRRRKAAENLFIFYYEVWWKKKKTKRGKEHSRPWHTNKASGSAVACYEKRRCILVVKRVMSMTWWQSSIGNSNCK